MPVQGLEIREERAGDFAAIATVNRLAFAGDEEARLVERLRADGLVAVSLVAVVARRVVGHILFSRLEVSGAEHCVSLAPMAVEPGYQLKGIGSALVRVGLERCRQCGVRAIVVVGHPSYYPRFGFSAELARGLTCRFAGPAFMAIELAPGGLGARDGTVTYPEAFGIW